MEGPALPQGWRREEFARRDGLSNGKYHVHYIDQSGQRFKNKSQLARFMGGGVDLTPFDWRSGKINPQLQRKVDRQERIRMCPDVARRLRYDHSLIPPLRQTASIFKQPVTIYRTQPNECPPVVAPTTSVTTRQVQDKIRQANNHEQQRAALAVAESKPNNYKPRQIFWEKRLQGQRATVADEEFIRFYLPKKIYSVIPKHITDDSIVRTISTALYDRRQSLLVAGQTVPAEEILKNPAIFIDPMQPPCNHITVEDEDIRLQEQRILKYRKEIERIIKLEIISSVTETKKEQENESGNVERSFKKET